MKFMRLAACAVAFAVVGGMVYAEDMDIKALQAKLAAQEARLNDLQAKMGSGAAATPANITSLRKNAKVTIGGDLDFRYIYDNYKTERFNPATGRRLADNALNDATDGLSKTRRGDAFVDTADLRVQIDVNENFDAFMRLGSYDGGKNTGVMRDAWIRWKNICNSGWGVLLGRDGLKFGMGKPIGMFDAWLQDSGARGGWGQGMMPHLNYGVSRVTQINPYWQSQDGKFRVDFSIFQTLESKTVADGGMYVQNADGNFETINYGVGSGTIRLQMKPTEDWTIVAAIAHLYADGDDGDIGVRQHANWDRPGFNWNDDRTESNTALHLGFIYNPAAFCKKLNVWAQATKEYNAGFWDDVDYFSANAGVSYAFTDKFTAFAMGDYVDTDWGAAGDVKGWRSYLGATYAMANGVTFEAGWTHQVLKDKDAGGHLVQKNKGDTLYTRLAFSF